MIKVKGQKLIKHLSDSQSVERWMWMLHDVIVVRPGFVQRCCTQACVRVRFSTRNTSQHVTTGWPNACNILRSTILLSVALKCYDRLAGACKCWATLLGYVALRCYDRLAGACKCWATLLGYVALRCSYRLAHRVACVDSINYSQFT